jgi:hypothetical protein
MLFICPITPFRASWKGKKKIRELRNLTLGRGSESHPASFSNRKLLNRISLLVRNTREVLFNQCVATTVLKMYRGKAARSSARI